MALAAAIVALLMVNARRAYHAPSFALPTAGPSWLTPVGGDLLVCHREGRLVLLDAELSPTVSTWARPFTHPAGFTGRAAVAGDLAFVGCADARLRAVDLRTGLQKWEALVGASAAAPTAAGNAVFVGTDNGTLYAVSADRGSVLWVVSVGARVASAPLVTEERVVVGTVAGMVHCLGRGSGEKLWRVTVDGPIYASPRKAGDSYLVGTDDGVVYRISARGEVSGQLTMDGLVRAAVAASDGVAVAADSEGLVCRFEPATMVELWRRRLAGPVAADPVVVGDRVWCAAGVDLVCLRAETGEVWWRRHGARQTVDCAVTADHVYWTTADGLVHKEPLPR